MLAGGETIPRLTGTTALLEETQTAMVIPENAATAVDLGSLRGGTRGEGKTLLVVGVLLLLVAVVVWWIKSRRADTPK